MKTVIVELWYTWAWTQWYINLKAIMYVIATLYYIVYTLIEPWLQCTLRSACPVTVSWPMPSKSCPGLSHSEIKRWNKWKGDSQEVINFSLSYYTKSHDIVLSKWSLVRETWWRPNPVLVRAVYQVPVYWSYRPRTCQNIDIDLVLGILVFDMIF